MQTAISTSIKEQRFTNQDKSFVAVYGFPDDGDDHREVLIMLDCRQNRYIIFSHDRISYVINHDTKLARRPNPIKVELVSPHDINLILNSSNILKREQILCRRHYC